MGNITSTEEQERIFTILVNKYELLKSKNKSNKDIFIALTYLFQELTSLEIPSLDLKGFNLNDVVADGIIRTEEFTLIGWNDGNEDVDIEGLTEIVKKNKNRED